MTAEAWTDGPIPILGWEEGMTAPVLTERTGLVRGPWGVFRGPGYWSLTHRPTGCSAGWFTQRRYAQSFAAALERLPIDWEAGTLHNFVEFVEPHRGAIRRLQARRSYTHPDGPWAVAKVAPETLGRVR